MGENHADAHVAKLCAETLSFSCSLSCCLAQVHCNVRTVAQLQRYSLLGLFLVLLAFLRALGPFLDHLVVAGALYALPAYQTLDVLLKTRLHDEQQSRHTRNRPATAAGPRRCAGSRMQRQWRSA